MLNGARIQLLRSLQRLHRFRCQYRRCIKHKDTLSVATNPDLLSKPAQVAFVPKVSPPKSVRTIKKAARLKVHVPQRADGVKASAPAPMEVLRELLDTAKRTEFAKLSAAISHGPEQTHEPISMQVDFYFYSTGLSAVLQTWAKRCSTHGLHQAAHALTVVKNLVDEFNNLADDIQIAEDAAYEAAKTAERGIIG